MAAVSRTRAMPPVDWTPASRSAGLRKQTVATGPGSAGAAGRGRSAAADVGRHREPAATAPGPDIGVPAGARLAVGPGVRGPRVDDRDIAHDAHVDVVGL